MSHANDTRAEIVQIRSLLKETKFNADLKLMKMHKSMNCPFSPMPSQHLIKLYDKDAETLIDEMKDKQGKTNVKFVGKCTIKVYSTIANRAIKEVV